MINLFLIGLVISTFINLLTGKKPLNLYCGLLGFSGEIPFSPDKIKLLMLYNQTRGEDSCGYYNHKEHIDPLHRITKRRGKASETIIPDSKIAPTNLLIGHTRKATCGLGDKGKVNNAHPFLIGNWVGAHNGVLSNLNALIKEYGFDSGDIEVDSQIFIEYINAFNNFEILKDFDGSAALLFTDVSNNFDTLYAYKNSKRPLYRGLFKKGDKKGMYLSSIKESLQAIGCTKISPIADETLYTIEAGEIQDTKRYNSKPIKWRHNPTVKKEEKSSDILLPEVSSSEKQISFNQGKLNKSNTAFKRASSSSYEYDEAPIKIKNRKEVSFYQEKDDSGKKWEVRVHDDYTVLKIRKNSDIPLQVAAEEIVYCSRRAMYIHVTYFIDGSYNEVKIQEPHVTEKIEVKPKEEDSGEDKVKEVETELGTDFINCTSGWYGKLFDFKNKLKQESEFHGYEGNNDLTELEEVLNNMEELMGIIGSQCEV